MDSLKKMNLKEFIKFMEKLVEIASSEIEFVNIEFNNVRIDIKIKELLLKIRKFDEFEDSEKIRDIFSLMIKSLDFFSDWNFNSYTKEKKEIMPELIKHLLCKNGEIYLYEISDELKKIQKLYID